MKKKVLSLLLAVVMVLSLMTVTAFAEVTEYFVYVNGVRVTSENMSDVLEDGESVTFTPGGGGANDKLTLTNAVLTKINYIGNETLDIEVKGTNTITPTTDRFGILTWRDDGHGVAENQDASLKISGDGTLTVDLTGTDATERKNGIFVNKDLTIKDVTLTVNIGDTQTNNHGIHAEHDITIDGAKVSSTVGSSAENTTKPICAYHDVIIKGGAEVTAVAGTSNSTTAGEGSFAIYATNDVKISDSATTVRATAGQGLNSYGIFATNDVVISGGMVTAAGGTADATAGASIGILASNAVTITGGRVSAKAGTGATLAAVAADDGTLTVGDTGNVAIITGAADGITEGGGTIAAGHIDQDDTDPVVIRFHDLDVTKNDGTDADAGDYEWGDGNVLAIKKNGLTVTGTTTTECIVVNSSVTDLTIEDLSITISSDNAPIRFAGSGTLTVKGDNTLTATNNSVSYSGLQFDSDGMITGDGNLSVTAKNNAIIAGTMGMGGTLTLACFGTITADSSDNVALCTSDMGSAINITASTGKILAYGHQAMGGAICGGGGVTLADNLHMKASLDRVEEADITDEAVFEDGCVMIGDSNYAQSVLIYATPWGMLNGAIQDESGMTWENEYFAVTYPGGYKKIALKQNITAGEDDGPLNVCKTHVELDLKGFTLDRGLSGKDAREDGHVFVVSDECKLGIVDFCVEKTGTITGGNAFYGGAAYITNGGCFELGSGTITGCHAFSETYDWQNSKLGRGGAVYMEESSKFKMSGPGAIITGCTASVAGGAVYVYGGEFNFDSGKITRCSVSGRLDDSAISSTKGKTKAKGGAVYLLAGSMQIKNGEISGNTLCEADIMSGAGVYVSQDESFYIGQAAKIFGNTDSKGNANNVYLRDGTSITIWYLPESGMSIGVTTETAPEKDKPVAFAKNVEAGFVDYFHADSPICKIGYTEAEGGTLWLELDEDAVCHYLEEVDEPVNNEHYTLKLNGREVGEYEFHRDNDSDPRSILKYTGSASVTPQFLTVENGRLAYTVRSDESNWVFDENGFHTTVTTSTQIPGFWFLFWYIPASTRITSTTYYLSTVTEGAKLSTRPVRTGLYTPTSGPHLYGEPVNNCDGTHTYTCERCGAEKTVNCAYLLEDETYCECGAYNPAKCDLDVECTPGRKTVYGWFWTRYTVFTMELKATGADAEDVTGIEYSIDGGRTWHRGTTITSNTEIIFFKVRVTDDHGTRIFSFPNNIADSIR